MPDPSGVGRLTDALLSPLTGHADHVPESAARASETLSRLAARAAGRPFRLTGHDVQVALAPPGEGFDPTPFAWSATTTRRALGLAAIRSLVAGEVRSPWDGVAEALARATAARDGERPLSAMDRWLAGLPRTGLAAVHAEATTWATRLWCALDWGAFVERPTIGRDHWCDSRGPSTLAIRSRAEVRAVSADRAGNPLSVHLVILGGTRRTSVSSELSVVALVETLCAPASLPPGRVVGWWPESGHLIAIEVDRAVVEAGVAAVAATISRAMPRAASRSTSRSVPPAEATPPHLAVTRRAAA
jgi:hypothetical protein